MTRTERQVLLGKVAVDSAQLLIIDPCYIDGGWRRTDGSHVVGVAFWGADADKVAEELKGHPSLASLEGEPGSRASWAGRYVATLHLNGDRPGVATTASLIARLRELGEGRRVRWQAVKDDTYSEVSNLTLGPDHGGLLPFRKGQEGPVGQAVAFSSGWGDGTYEVRATIRDYGAQGERVTKVEVILIPDEDDVPDQLEDE